MVTESAVDRGIIDQPVVLELISSGQTELAPVIKLHPKSDPMQFTRDDFLSLQDGNSRIDVLVDLRRNPYDLARSQKAKVLFPEGFDTPLSETERRVFGSMKRVMDAGDGALPEQDLKVLEEHLHGVPTDQIIAALEEEGAHRREGHFWATRQEIGGYSLNRLIAFEAENQAEVENIRDEMRLHSLQDEARLLAGRNLTLRDADIAEMERLEDEYEERKKSKDEYWQAEREKGYPSYAKVH